MVITIGRSCGSGGLEIAQKLALRLGVCCYDADTLLAEAEAAGCAEKMRAFLAEKPVNSLLYSIAVENDARGMGRVPFALMHQIAAREDFVLLGHCGNYALRDRSDLTTLFIHGDLEDRVQRIVERYRFSEKDAAAAIKATDRRRKTYYEKYTQGRWGSIESHQMLLNVSRLRMERTVEIIRGIYEA